MSEAAWEPRLQAWARPPGVTESEKMARAEKAIRDAIAASPALSTRDIVVFPQGSYRNRTSVPRESDVDICVMTRDVVFVDWDWVDESARTNATVRRALEAEAGLADTPYTYEGFKNDVEAALVAKFGRAAVVRGDKAFDIRENTYRVESDCLAAYESRSYRRDAAGRLDFVTGTEFMSDSGRRIQNFPDQQYVNGVAKHTATGDRFKKMVRVVKNLRNEMDDEGKPEAGPIASFLTECLVYNVPDDQFANATHYDRLREVLRFLYHATTSDETCGKWLEENQVKFLFHPSQSWTRAQANAFVLAAWQHAGFED